MTKTEEGRLATLVLASVPQSAGRARRFCAERLAGVDEETVDTVVLLVSEVVTNAVLHAHSDIALTLSRRGAAVRVEVADGSALLPTPRAYGETAATGRGLGLVEALAASFGVEARPDGKTVWFTVGSTGPVTVSAGWATASAGPDGARR